MADSNPTPGASTGRTKSTSKSVSSASGSRSKSTSSAVTLVGSSRGSKSSVSGTTLVGSSNGSGEGSGSGSGSRSSLSGTTLVSSGRGSKSSMSGTTLVDSSNGSKSSTAGKTLVGSSSASGDKSSSSSTTLFSSSKSASSDATTVVDSSSGSRTKSTSSGKGSISKPKAAQTPARKPSIPRKAPGTIIKRGPGRGLTVPNGHLSRGRRTRQAPVRFIDEFDIAPVKPVRKVGAQRRAATTGAPNIISSYKALRSTDWPQPRPGRVWWPADFDLPVYEPGHPGLPWNDCPEETRYEILATPEYRGGPPPKEEDTKLWVIIDKDGNDVPRGSEEWNAVIAGSKPGLVRHKPIDEYWDNVTSWNEDKGLTPVKWWPRRWGVVWLHGKSGQLYYNAESHLIRQILQIPGFQGGMLPPTNSKGEYDVTPIRIPGIVPNKEVDDYWDAVQSIMRVPWWPADWSPVWAPGHPGEPWMPHAEDIRCILQLPGYKGGPLPAAWSTH